MFHAQVEDQPWRGKTVHSHWQRQTQAAQGIPASPDEGKRIFGLYDRQRSQSCILYVVGQRGKKTYSGMRFFRVEKKYD